MKLGVGRRNAIITGLTSKGLWKLSKSPAVNQAMSNGWLEEQGLLSLKALWVAIHYPTTVR